MTITVERANLTDPIVRALIAAHNAFSEGSTPPASSHSLPATALAAPDMTVWAAWHAGDIAGVGALKTLSADAAEVKSMHTRKDKRGLGIATRLLDVIVAEAERRGYRTLYLETGSGPQYRAGRALYRRNGFTPIGPFGDYGPDPLSAFYTKALKVGETAL